MSVDDDSAPPSAGVRCGACGARNSGGAAWCSLCFSALADPVPDAAQVEVPDGAPSAPRHAAEAVEEQLDEAEVTAMLAELSAAERPAARWSAVSGLVGSPGARVAVMLAGTLVVAAAGFGLLTALGSLLAQ